MAELARKAVKLHRAGGSRAVVLPSQWLAARHIETDVELVLRDDGILITPARPTKSIEDEPEFAHFLAFLARDALTRPERLGDVGELMDGDDELFEGVTTE